MKEIENRNSFGLHSFYSCAVVQGARKGARTVVGDDRRQPEHGYQRDNMLV